MQKNSAAKSRELIRFHDISDFKITTQDTIILGVLKEFKCQHVNNRANCSLALEEVDGKQNEVEFHFTEYELAT